MGGQAVAKQASGGRTGHAKFGQVPGNHLNTCVVSVFLEIGEDASKDHMEFLHVELQVFLEMCWRQESSYCSRPRLRANQVRDIA